MSTTAAEPYPRPFDGDLRPADTALVVIDMKVDVRGIGGCGPTDRADHDAALRRIPLEGGVFGAVSTADALLAGLAP